MSGPCGGAQHSPTVVAIPAGRANAAKSPGRYGPTDTVGRTFGGHLIGRVPVPAVLYLGDCTRKTMPTPFLKLAEAGPGRAFVRPSATTSTPGV